ncbi:MAG: hypothetical protein IKF78_13265 [Atopobiaceae bacterium]|nr:hypothetical protein [Atopobiaceae bacterium]
MADHFSEYDAFNVPPEFRPLGTFAYIGLSILYSIPIIGTIFMIVFSFSDANINRRNYSRMFLFFYVLNIVLLLVLFFTGRFDAYIQAFQTGGWNALLGMF